MPSTTSDTAGARAHARAMAGTQVVAMPTIPATSATDLPPGVASADVVWDETIAAGGYGARVLKRGSRVQLTDLYGDGAVAMMVFNAERPVERLNVADTVKIQWNAYLGAGRFLLSDMGRVLMSVIEDDTCGHDAFCGASNQASNARKYGDGYNHGAHPNARDRFVIALAKYGMTRRDIHPCVNWFKPVAVAADGAIELDHGPHAARQHIILRAEMDVIVVIANCPHVRDPRDGYTVTPVRATAWAGPVTPPDDAVRMATPEGLRAFENVEDYYRR